MKTMSKRTSISERLRAAILTAGESRYRIAKQTGVSQALLSRFVHRKQSINLTAVDALARHLQLDLLRIVVEPATPAKAERDGDQDATWRKNAKALAAVVVTSNSIVQRTRKGR